MYAIRSYYAGPATACPAAEECQRHESGVQVGLGAGAAACRGASVVITSYSIHYTKLYDSDDPGRTGRVQLECRLDVGFHFFGEDPDRIRIFQNFGWNFLRIVAYPRQIIRAGYNDFFSI